ncbi:unnamed protein product [Leptosia nina]|uniref:Uncharacterized protein n=1 Tax=Leptosia nina TaxID=320188 RepID=A0AAV1K7B0_9NEOP
MSFLSSLSQYVAGVADSVAGLALSPRRVPPSRHRSAEESQQQPQSSAATMRGEHLTFFNLPGMKENFHYLHQSIVISNFISFSKDTIRIEKNRK